MANLKPLITDSLHDKLLWEKPERKDQSGSITILGGFNFKLKEVDTIFKAAKGYGVGSVFALVPESLAKVFKREDPYLVPITLDNYFGLTDFSFEKINQEVAISNALIIADIGNNSSTILRLARLVSNSIKPVVITNSSISLGLSFAEDLLKNPNLILIINFQNLQKIIKSSNIKLNQPLTSELGILKKIDLMNNLTSNIQAKIILIDEKRVISVESGYYLNQPLNIDELSLASKLTAWRIWSPSTNFLEHVSISNQAN
jgi:NAD(P)H-hydrate repair Nnr-like enzyme with NAD(P)H-hydrate dehydratase domain